MNKLRLPVLALAALTILPTACDDRDPAAECPGPAELALATPSEAPPPDISFREQGPPAGLYTTKLSGAMIKRASVAKMVMSAEGQPDPNETCTLSWYQPDTTKDEMVLGLGCSMLAPLSLWQHYRQIFLANGAVPLP